MSSGCELRFIHVLPLFESFCLFLIPKRLSMSPKGVSLSWMITELSVLHGENPLELELASSICYYPILGY